MTHEQLVLGLISLKSILLVFSPISLIVGYALDETDWIIASICTGILGLTLLMV